MPMKAFTNSLTRCTHIQDWKEAGTVRRGYELNYDLLAMQTAKHPGALKDEHSFLQVQAENIVMTAAKEAGDDRGPRSPGRSCNGSNETS